MHRLAVCPRRKATASAPRHAYGTHAIRRALTHTAHVCCLRTGLTREDTHRRKEMGCGDSRPADANAALGAMDLTPEQSARIKQREATLRSTDRARSSNVEGKTVIGSINQGDVARLSTMHRQSTRSLLPGQ